MEITLLDQAWIGGGGEIIEKNIFLVYLSAASKNYETGARSERLEE
jgi:hypothetical protein